MPYHSLSNRRQWQTTHVNFGIPAEQHNQDLIFSPNGSQILTLPGGRPPISPSRVECPRRPRLRHNPSLVDASQPPPLEDDDEDLGPVVHRKNPCCLCNVGFFHGAMNFAIISTGLHFFLMFYCVYVALYTQDYTLGFLKFWGIEMNWDEDSDDTQHLLTEVHITSVVGCTAEMMGLILGVELIYGIISEIPVWCNMWCVLSSILTAIEMFGVAFLATRLSFMVLIPIPFAVMVQIFGLWVIVTYIRALGDPKRCPVCHQLIKDQPIVLSDHSLPTSISDYCPSPTTVSAPTIMATSSIALTDPEGTKS